MSELSRELTALVADIAAGLNTQSPQAQWTQLSALGLTGIGIPESSGGSGGMLGDLLVVISGLAQHGVANPLLEGAVAGFARGVVAEDAFGTVALASVPDVDHVGGMTTLRDVPYAAEASELIVIADDRVVSLPATDVSRDSDIGVNLAGQPCADVRVDLANASALDIAASAVRNRLSIARSAALLGSGLGAYELTKSYVSSREQFGAPLVKIPAVASALADMATVLRLAQSTLRRADNILGDEAAETRLEAAVDAARLVAARAATHIARTAHQLHGAVGVTDEYPLHRLTTALWAWRDADEPEDRVSARLGAVARARGESSIWVEMTG